MRPLKLKGTVMDNTTSTEAINETLELSYAKMFASSLALSAVTTVGVLAGVAVYAKVESILEARKAKNETETPDQTED